MCPDLENSCRDDQRSKKEPNRLESDRDRGLQSRKKTENVRGFLDTGDDLATALAHGPLLDALYLPGLPDPNKLGVATLIATHRLATAEKGAGDPVDRESLCLTPVSTSTSR